ncbi:hypothetical protein XAC3810_440003 [Xanthomonas citri pv. citri]|uniref:Uncharacterized protein n=1 Tax=Xanthomonas citri pv. citri TaxID=611301 RepID=A0A0U5FG99_XANCI|nr:hypothetical protein XAC9322_450082 [Xanthomonas citri pv. citri]CEE28586.1 hypothetical protein XAC3824_560081 [Xanthomonas citri pv. citri]CEE30180.1 hypothetical protein XAC1083_440096 [Xanthomonas citri pv. citri]CEE39452.1 hypothetical protein XAC3810_440003 [Xanthomonas citri pv. citri]CEE41765.1 hypothetical protein XAC902_610082 [Xanthomonas citri pv. citri]
MNELLGVVLCTNNPRNLTERQAKLLTVALKDLLDTFAVSVSDEVNLILAQSTCGYVHSEINFSAEILLEDRCDLLDCSI